jgi:hypothetical protein
MTVTSSSMNSDVAWNDLYGIAVDCEGRVIICSQGTNMAVRVM